MYTLRPDRSERACSEEDSAGPLPYSRGLGKFAASFRAVRVSECFFCSTLFDGAMDDLFIDGSLGLFDGKKIRLNVREMFAALHRVMRRDQQTDTGRIDHLRAG